MIIRTQNIISNEFLSSEVNLSVNMETGSTDSEFIGVSRRGRAHRSPANDGVAVESLATALQV